VKISLCVTVLVAGAALPARADEPLELGRRLEALRSPGPISATVQLDLRLDQKLHGKITEGQATLRVEIEQDANGLNVRWAPSVLQDANAEEGERDRDPSRLTPIRQAMTELDPARLAHLLDQAHTIASLAKGAPSEEKASSYEGQAARQLVYRFKPRLTWTEAYYLHHSEGRFTLWIATDGTPLASESAASYEGKTSRSFGRFHGKTTIRTVYVAEGQRLRVGKREADELVSHDDGGDVLHTTRKLVIGLR
jgi:hypothetical protein